MATVINNPSASPSVERVEHVNDSGAGWAVAIVVLLAVLAIGAFVWMRFYQAPAAAPSSNGGANINVTLPEAPAGNPSGAGTGGGTNNGSGGTQPAE